MTERSVDLGSGYVIWLKFYEDGDVAVDVRSEHDGRHYTNAIEAQGSWGFGSRPYWKVHELPQAVAAAIQWVEQRKVHLREFHEQVEAAVADAQAVAGVWKELSA